MADRPEIHYGLVGVEIGLTSICEIDGKEGRLFYRGFPIQELAARPYEDVAFLLIRGRMPSEGESSEFKRSLSAFRRLPDAVYGVLDHCRHRHPYVALQMGLASLTIDDSDPDSDAHWISAATSIIAHHHAVRLGKRPLPPDESLDHATDFLLRLGGTMPSVDAARAMNADFVLHAEHGAAASTVAVRVAAGQEASLRAAISAGMSCLSGPRHGGAVDVVGKLLSDLASPAKAKEFAIKAHKAGEAIHGFGHRVYKVEDPRSKVYRAIIDDLIVGKGRRPQVVEIAEALVEAMTPMRRFGIAPNDDLAAATLYRLLGLPPDLNLSLFAASRLAGWIAHFREARDQPAMPIPRLAFVDSKTQSMQP